jgi:primase-polymerase (primpol)-like protein
MIDALTEFEDEKRWLSWQEENRNGNWTKPPHSARTGGYGSATDPLTWSTRPEAEAYCREHFSGKRKHGIGIVLGDRSPQQ